MPSPPRILSIATATPRAETDSNTTYASPDNGFGKALDHAKTDADSGANTATERQSASSNAADSDTGTVKSPTTTGKQSSQRSNRAHDKSSDDKDKDKHGADKAPQTLPVLTAIEAAKRQISATACGNPLPTAASGATTATASQRPTLTPSSTTTAAAPSSAEAHAMRTHAQSLNNALTDITDATGQDTKTGATTGLTDHKNIDTLGASAAATLTPPSTQAATPVPVHNLQIAAPPQSPDFGQTLSQHVAWLSGQDVQQARIQLHPRDLGPIHVQVQVRHDHVDVSFAAQHPDTVHALQQTLPQLDSMFARHGLSLGQAQVGQQHDGSAGGQSGHGHADQVGTHAGEDATRETIMPTVTHPLGLVDAFV